MSDDSHSFVASWTLSSKVRAAGRTREMTAAACAANMASASPADRSDKDGRPKNPVSAADIPVATSSGSVVQRCMERRDAVWACFVRICSLYRLLGVYSLLSRPLPGTSFADARKNRAQTFFSFSCFEACIFRSWAGFYCFSDFPCRCCYGSDIVAWREQKSWVRDPFLTFCPNGCLLVCFLGRAVVDVFALT